MKWRVQLKQNTDRLQLDFHATWEARITGLFGPSGSGKSTVLKHILGLKKKTRWEGVISLGEEILQDSGQKKFLSPQKRKFGWVPQDCQLFPHLTVKENILFSYVPKPQEPGKPHISPDLVVRILGIEPLLNAYPAQISGGEMQRVALARALLAGSRALILDEPFSSLDLNLRKTAHKLLKQIQEAFHLPILVISHNWADMLDLCDHVLVLQAGGLIYEGAPTEFDLEKL